MLPVAVSTRGQFVDRRLVPPDPADLVDRHDDGEQCKCYHLESKEQLCNEARLRLVPSALPGLWCWARVSLAPREPPAARPNAHTAAVGLQKFSSKN